MKIAQASSQFIQPSINQKGDALVNSVMRAKENLSSQMQKLNQDKSIDEKTKQAKLKQLQTQMEELEQQLQKRQMEKLVEDSTKVVTESNNTSDSYKTAEESEKEAGVAISKSLISASVSRGHLEHLGAIRSRLILEDGEGSERVQRTERMMGEQTVQINQALDENRKALQAYAQSSKEAEENRQAEREVENQNEDNIIENIEEIPASGTNEQVESEQAKSEQADTADSRAENVEQKHKSSRKEVKVRETEFQPPTKSSKIAKAMPVTKEPETNIDISV